MKNKYLQRLNFIILFSCMVGIFLSLYTLYIENKMIMDEDYHAVCDISEAVSCSKVLRSKYGRGMGLLDDNNPLSLPNGLYGVIFYAFLGFLTTSDNIYITKLQFIFSLASIAMTMYLAYILVAVLRDFCIICIGTYIVNVVVFMSTIAKYRELKCEEEESEDDECDRCYCD